MLKWKFIHGRYISGRFRITLQIDKRYFLNGPGISDLNAYHNTHHEAMAVAQGVADREENYHRFLSDGWVPITNQRGPLLMTYFNKKTGEHTTPVVCWWDSSLSEYVSGEEEVISTNPHIVKPCVQKVTHFKVQKGDF